MEEQERAPQSHLEPRRPTDPAGARDATPPPPETTSPPPVTRDPMSATTGAAGGRHDHRPPVARDRRHARHPRVGISLLAASRLGRGVATGSAALAASSWSSAPSCSSRRSPTSSSRGGPGASSRGPGPSGSSPGGLDRAGPVPADQRRLQLAHQHRDRRRDHLLPVQTGGQGRLRARIATARRTPSGRRGSPRRPSTPDSAPRPRERAGQPRARASSARIAATGSRRANGDPHLVRGGVRAQPGDLERDAHRVRGPGSRRPLQRHLAAPPPGPPARLPPRPPAARGRR